MKNTFWLIPMLLLVAGCGLDNDGSWPKLSPPSKANTVTDCQALDKDFIPYQSTRAQFSFCYPKAWGEVSETETSISPEFRKGTSWEISFSQEPNGLSTYYYTQDFQVTGPRDAGQIHEEINWAAIYPSMNSEQLAKALQIPNATIKTIERTDVDNTFGFYVTSDFIDPLGGDHIQDIYWMYPRALENEMILVVGGKLSEKTVLEKIASSLRFFVAIKTTPL